MSFGDTNLTFVDDGFIRVSGVNDNPLDNAVSNGSGKSSLWEAIIWALTGDTIRGTKHVVNIFGEDGCYVDLEFIVDSKHYRILRSKDHKVYKTNLQIYIDEQDVSGKGIRDSEKLLAQYLPDLTASLLGSVIILGQGLPQKFTNNTPSGRKEVLEKLSKSDFMIEDLKTRVSQRKSHLTQVIREQEDKDIEYKTLLNVLTKQIEDATNMLSSLNSEDLENKLFDAKRKQKEIQNNLDELECNLNEETEKYNDISSMLNQASSKKTADLYTIRDEYETNSKPYSAKLNELTGELNALKKQLKAIDSISDVCPTCGQKLLNVEKPDTTSLNEQIQTLQSDIADLEATLKHMDTVYKANVSQINDKYTSDTQDLHSQQNELVIKIKSLESNKNKLVSEQRMLCENISSVELKIAQLQSTIDNCNKIIRDNNEKIEVTSQQILYNNKQKGLTQSHLEVVSKFDTALKRDFRGYLLSTVISYIESRAKQYCKIIFDTTNISFCLDGNNIDISYMNKAYENLSGGEKQKIDLIIQFSIRDMLSSQLGFTSNILVLDEVFDGLDLNGCNRVIDMIASLSDVKNIFIVTHRKDLSIPTDKELTVFKSSVGISEIR